MSSLVQLRISIISLLLMNYYVSNIGGLPTMTSNNELSSHKSATELGKEPDEQKLVKYPAVDGQIPETKSEQLPLAQARGGSKGSKGFRSGRPIWPRPVFVSGYTSGLALPASSTFLTIGIFLCCFIFCYSCCMAHCPGVDHMYEPPLYQGVY